MRQVVRAQAQSRGAGREVAAVAVVVALPPPAAGGGGGRRAAAAAVAGQGGDRVGDAQEALGLCVYVGAC